MKFGKKKILLMAAMAASSLLFSGRAKADNLVEFTITPSNTFGGGDYNATGGTLDHGGDQVTFVAPSPITLWYDESPAVGAGASAYSGEIFSQDSATSSNLVVSVLLGTFNISGTTKTTFDSSDSSTLSITPYAVPGGGALSAAYTTVANVSAGVTSQGKGTITNDYGAFTPTLTGPLAGADIESGSEGEDPSGGSVQVFLNFGNSLATSGTPLPSSVLGSSALLGLLAIGGLRKKKLISA